DCELAAVGEVVLGDVPDAETSVAPGPLARGVGNRPLDPGLEVGVRPPPQTRVHERPRGFQGPHDLRRRPALGLLTLVELRQGVELRATLSHPGVAPPDPGRGDVAGDPQYRQP